MTRVAWAGAAETHSAAVYFAGERAFKVKKPVDLGFLDFRSLAVREAVCHREVELNRRLAPDVYLGVADLVGPGGEPFEHAVVMRRMPGDRRLSTLVEAGADVGGDLWRLAHLLAAFHAGAERGPAADEAAGVEATAGRWRANTSQLDAFAGRYVDGDDVGAVDGLAERYLDGRRPLFAHRVDAGRACDGHGDLLADDIFCLEDGPRVLDCIEFDDRLRLGDGLADVAFLAMDLERLGRPDLAGQFLAAYREHAADTWPASLAHHHIAYRAQVRAKVAAVRAAQGDDPSAGQARRLLGLARAHLDAGRVRLVLVGGLPGTGKSTVAAGLGASLGATVLRSDELRREGAASSSPPAPARYGEGAYRPGLVAATYRALLDRAGVALGMGETVVLDASWSDRRRREEARAVARAAAADLVELRCTAPDRVAAARMRARVATGFDPSDATPEVAAAMASAADPWPEASALDTAQPPAAAVATAARLVAGAQHRAGAAR